MIDLLPSPAFEASWALDGKIQAAVLLDVTPDKGSGGHSVYLS